ncbi:MAG: putative toxin-antitoxin system toxin component, PIN family [Bacteroidia bacterium]|nr:putative toxin-antitoxin system toxin component, PIN family [Bacteroidia bacterium]
MHKIVLDTNIVVSALICDGYPSVILEEVVFAQKAIICLSEMVFQEYITVLSRVKFLKYPEFRTNADIVLSTIEQIALKFKPDIIITEIKDISDNKFLELAVFAKADFLITGNTNHFIFPEYKGVKIISPKDYIENYFKKI